MKKQMSLLLAAMLAISVLMTACGNTDSSSSQTSASAASSAEKTDKTAPADEPTSSSEEAGETASADEAAPVEIRAAWWGDTKRNDVYNAIVDRFSDEYSHVTVVREPLSWGDYWEKLAVQTAGGNAPDFMGMNYSYASDYLRRNTCEPLDKYIDDGVINLSGWSQGTINTGVLDGVTYMIPMGVTFKGMFINTGMLDQFGVEGPDFDWTWEDVKTIGLQVREAADAAGETTSWFLQDMASDMGTWRYYVLQQDRDIYDNEGNITFEISDAESWFSMFKEFRELGIVPDPETSTEFSSTTLEDSLFSKDRLISLTNAANQYALYKETFPDKEIDLLRFPSESGKASGMFPEGSHFVISSRSTDDQKLAAAQLLNFWVNDERSLELFLLDQGVPGNLDKVATAVMPNLNEYQQIFVEYVDKMSEIGKPVNFPPIGTAELMSEFTLISDNVAFGMTTPEEAAQEFHDKAVEIRSKD